MESENSVELEINEQVITAGNDVVLMALGGKEGIGQTWLARMTYRQAHESFGTESDKISKANKLQRKADKKRIGNIFNYLVDRDNTIFPSACLVVGHLEIEKLIDGAEFGVSYDVFKAIVPASADRLFIDGQGRKGGIGKAIEVKPELADHILDVKIVVSPTPRIYDSATFVRQIFSDYHLGLVKPNTSQNIYFNSEQPHYRLTNEVLQIASRMELPFSKLVAVDGKIEQCELFTLANVSDFVAILTGEKNIRKRDKLLSEKSNYELYLTLVYDFLSALTKPLGLDKVASMSKSQWTEAKNTNLAYCAIGLKALALFGRSMIEDALANETAVSFSLTESLSSLPFSEKDNSLWFDKEIYQKIDGKTKIVKGSEKRLAMIMCRNARLMPCEAMM